MNASSGCDSGFTREAGPPTFTQSTPRRAPGPAPQETGLAILIDGIALTRLDQPQGAVVVEAGDTMTVVVRINRLARTLRGATPDGPRLTQCLAPDFILLIEPGRQASLPAHDDQDLLIVRATTDAICRMTGRPFHLPTNVGRPLADRFLTELVERAFSGDATRAEALLRPLFMELAMTATPIRRTMVKGGLNLSQLARLRDHVEMRLSHPVPITELARLVNLSPFHFSRAFKASMGIAPATWIRLRRLTVAQALLTDPSHSVINVAAAVGYESPSRFANAFRSFTGLTPSVWRRAAAESSVLPVGPAGRVNTALSSA